jgi:hypothetical protein
MPYALQQKPKRFEFFFLISTSRDAVAHRDQ